MLDNYNEFKGHLKIERLDKEDNIIDIPVDYHNMIMTPARLSMAEIFAKLDGCKYANKVILGTLGHKSRSIYIPKDTSDGFTKERDRMFSQPSSDIYNVGDVLDIICKNDIVSIHTSNGTKYYIYKGETSTQFILSQEQVDKMELIDKLPYTLQIDFTMPGQNGIDGTENVPPDSPYSVQVTQQDTSVTFVIEVPMDAGNDQYVNNPDYGIPTSVYTEASLWVNDRIFSLKTFQGITKDDSVKLRVTWTITF